MAVVVVVLVVLGTHQGRVVVRAVVVRAVVGGGVHHHVCVERWVVGRRVVESMTGRSYSSVVLRTVVGAWVGREGGLVGREGGLVGAAPWRENINIYYSFFEKFIQSYFRYITV